MTKTSHPKYEDDFIRWIPPEEDLEKDLTSQLPFVVALAIRNSVRSYGSDTATLLNHVYLTKPMLSAAPGEALDLGCEMQSESVAKEALEVEPQRPMTKREKDERKKKMQDLRSLIRERLDNKRRDPDLVVPDPPPRYDEVFLQGLACLEAEAGPPLEERQERAAFSDDVWKSPARYDPELS